MSYKYKAVRLKHNKFLVVDVEGCGDMWVNIICKGEDNEDGLAYSSLVVSSLNNAPRLADELFNLKNEMKKQKED